MSKFILKVIILSIVIKNLEISTRHQRRGYQFK